MKNDKLKILYEDKYIIIVEKTIHCLTIANDKEKENTLYHKVSLYLKRKNKNNKVFIVHRLDYDTSGLVIFAKDIKTKKILQDNWNMVIRKYIAIVNGIIENKNGTIKSYLKETRTKLVYSTSDSRNGVLAVLNYKKIIDINNYSMLEIDIKTGKKNQIRVQLCDLGFPIVGDKKYGPKNKEKRLYLHAYYLKLNHPITNQIIEIEQDVPKEFLLKLDIM